MAPSLEDQGLGPSVRRRSRLWVILGRTKFRASFGRSRYGPFSPALVLGSQGKDCRDRSEEEEGKQRWVETLERPGWDRPVLTNVSPLPPCASLT